ncbi:MAG: transferrin receptor-like dimerization domain-containing protein [Rhizomicrobium sp.]
MAAIAVLSLTTAFGGAVQAPAGTLLGFSPAGSDGQRALERIFDAGLSAEEQRRWMKALASKANSVGTPHDRANAEWMLAQFKSWGWEAHIETFYALDPTPVAEKLELLGKHPFTAALHEPPLPGDASSAQTADVLPPYLVYQGDGDVTAEVVYANYGMPEDYEALQRAGIDVKGKIVITRYGNGWRGLKPQLAQEHGAVGCLIYSDPADDGYGTDDPYPKGSGRPRQGVQRGSVQKVMVYPGDPLTPGVGATKDAKRLTRENAPTILKIPALPISYGDAEPLLAAIEGPVAPRGFRGQLPLTYHLGPSKAKVHLLVRSDWSLKPIYDVIATIRGSEAPDQWVIRGNHHDAWVFGAWDPLAGTVALLGEAKSIGGLLKTGWRPKRTIVYASWDGEEPGMIGSTEWAEERALELSRKAVIYVNSDDNARGILGAGASHELQRLVNEASADVRDPETGASVQARLRAYIQVQGLTDPDLAMVAKMIAGGGDIPVYPIGSGSDYSVFLQHLGVPSINLGYGYAGEDGDAGIFHSLYDTFEHFSRFSDPTFGYEVALSQTAGRLVLREADAAVLPLQFRAFAGMIAAYVDELKALQGSLKSKAEAQDKLISAHAFTLAADPIKKTYRPPEPEAAPPALDFTSLDTAVTRLEASAMAYDSALAASGGALSPDRAAKLNGILQNIDQSLLDSDGLPGRPWFQNLAYAPGLLSGYGVKTLPGVREAIEGRRWTEAQTYIARTAKALEEYAARVDAAAAVLAKN